MNLIPTMDFNEGLQHLFHCLSVENYLELPLTKYERTKEISVIS